MPTYQVGAVTSWLGRDGGRGVDRTPDLHRVMVLRYRCATRPRAESKGLEPPTALTATCFQDRLLVQPVTLQKRKARDSNPEGFWALPR